MLRFASLIAATSLVVGVSSHPHPAPQVEGGPSELAQPIENFAPPSFASYVQDIISIASFQEEGDFVSAATNFVQDTFPDLTFRTVDDSYVGMNGIGHVNFRQTVHGYDLDNADVNVNVAGDGSIFSYGSAVYKGALPKDTPDLSKFVQPKAALDSVQKTFGLPGSLASADITEAEGGNARYVVTGAEDLEQDAEIQLVYYRPAADVVVPAWRVEVDLGINWITSYVEANGEATRVLAASDYASDASYNVYPWPIANPDEGGARIVRNPETRSGSPLGWHNNGKKNFYTTEGNNGFAQPNREGGEDVYDEMRPSSGALAFEYPIDLRFDPVEYTNFSTTQLFYTANKYHDLLYALGFNEVAGNFQDDNLGKGGKGGDGVILNTQDNSGLNNANFLTPPDGQRGRMRMYIWDYTTPRRDSSLDAGVVIHEYTHGLSNRLTGGKANGRCLTTVESRGMGEGWSDFFATAVRIGTQDSRKTNYPMGEYVSGDPTGIRAYPYSTSLTTNPVLYNSINNLTAVHAIGHIWSSILYEVLWNLIDEMGNTDSDIPSFDVNGVPADGRYMAMKIVMDGLALQPCNPTIAQARDAIADADSILTGGAYQCQIWRGFAKRGLGVDSSGLYPRVVNNYDVPEGC